MLTSQKRMNKGKKKNHQKPPSSYSSKNYPPNIQSLVYKEQNVSKVINYINNDF